jgi:hypothetical protein
VTTFQISAPLNSKAVCRELWIFPPLILYYQQLYLVSVKINADDLFVSYLQAERSEKNI